MNKPTKQQIDQADRLQKAGLCQGARNTIKFVEWRNGESEYMLATPLNGHITALVIGPIPTFEEVWVELRPLLKERNLEMPLTGHAFFLIQRDKIVRRQYHFDNHTPTTAAIEALLLLKGEG